MYAKLAIALVLLLALVGAYVKGRSDGGKIVQADYAQRDLKAAQDYAAKEREITEKYRSKEANWQSQFVAASKAYQRGLANAETAKLAAIAGVESGAIKLRLNDSADCKVDGNTTSEIAASASGRNDSAEGRFLGKADSAFLIAEASRSDKIVMQLSACQQILRSERQ